MERVIYIVVGGVFYPHNVLIEFVVSYYFVLVIMKADQLHQL